MIRLGEEFYSTFWVAGGDGYRRGDIIGNLKRVEPKTVTEIQYVPVMESSIVYNIFKEFGFAGGRLREHGPGSGEEFKEILHKLLVDHDKVTLDLDGAPGYSASFLDEVFGSLVKKGAVILDKLNTMEIVATEKPYLIRQIRGIIAENVEDFKSGG